MPRSGILYRLRESTLSAVITVVIILITLVTLYLVQTTLKDIEASLPVKISEQKGDITVLYQNLTDTVQSARVYRYLPEHRGNLVSDVARLQLNLARLRDDYTFDSLLGVSAFHAALSPAVQDVSTWLALGVASYPAGSPEVIELVNKRLEGVLAEANVMLLGVDQRASEILVEQAEAIARFRSITTMALAGVTLLTMLLIYYMFKQRNSRRRLEAREQQFREFAMVGSDYLWEMDAELRFSWLSDGYEKLIGLPVSSVIGKTYQELWSAAQQKPLATLDDLDLLAYRQPFSNVTFDWQLRDGRIKTIRVAGKPIFNRAGVFKGYRGVVNNVSPLAEARSRAENLQRKAEAANVAKTSFLSRISHEIRTPLTIILGMIDRTDKVVEDKQGRRTLDMMRESAERMLLILNRVLDVSKIESGYFQTEASPFQLRDTMTFVVESMRDAAEQKGNVLTLNIAAELDDSRNGDFIRIEQVLRNLISNAIKATVDGRISVIISGPSDSQDSHCLNFAIIDTGIGIPSVMHEEVFEPFVQHRPSSQRDRSGIGLGLHICKRMVEAMGGSLTLSSRVGKGSTFRFDLPVPVLEIESIESRKPGSSGSSRCQGLDILLAEDDEIIQTLVEDCFEDSPHALQVVSDGREAVSRFQQHSFDLVLMDLQMPVMDGFEATREIRRLEAKADAGSVTPIVALSASALSADIASCREAGFSDHLSKPVRKASILSLVAALPAQTAKNWL